MTIDSAKISEIQSLAAKYGAWCQEVGYSIATVEPNSDYDANRAELDGAWQNFQDALWALGEDSPQPEEGSGGVKSSPAEDPCGRRKIDTIQELDALPEEAVVLDPHDSAFQKYSTMHWEGLGRTWDSIQVELPVTVIFQPEAKA